MKNFYKIFSFALLVFVTGCIQNGPEIPEEVIGAKVPEFEGVAKWESKTASTIEVTATVGRENGYKITERGFLYGTSPSPSEENDATKVIDTDMDTDKRTGSYTLTIEGLNNNTTYYIRPYAINRIGTGYASELTTSTNEGMAEIETWKPKTDFVFASSALTGVVIIFRGEGSIEKAGVYYYEKGHIEQADSFFCEASNLINAAQGDTLFCQLTGLKPDTEYEVQAFFVNKYGLVRGKTESFHTQDGILIMGTTERIERGYTEVTLSSSVSNEKDESVLVVQRGFCWSIGTVTTTPDVSNNIDSCGVGTGVFVGTITGLSANTVYYARSFAVSNFGVTVYGDVIDVRTKTDVPTVITEEVTGIESGNATVKGLIDDEGEYPVTLSGICWSRTNNVPNINNDSALYLVAGADSVFSGQLTKLRGGITYYVRAFARNSRGIVYGEVKTFRTPPIFSTGLSPFEGAMRYPNTVAYFSIGQQLYMLGGDLGPSCSNELWRYSVATNRWEELLPFPAGPAKWQYGITYGNGAYVYGGFNPNGSETTGLYYYDPYQNRWYYYNGPDSVVVYHTVGYAFSNSVFYVGGISNDTIRQDVWGFDNSYKSWDKKTDFPVKQYGGVAVALNTATYVGLGRGDNGLCNGTLWSTSDDAHTWAYVSNTNITGFVAGGVAMYGRLYVVVVDGTTHYMLEYNPDTDEWTRKAQFPSGHVAFHCIFMANNRIYIGIGGNSIMVYDPLWDNL